MSNAYQAHIGFQSAVRIAVWLKRGTNVPYSNRNPVSIRRADRCLVEGHHLLSFCASLRVSIRRADRCLVEDLRDDRRNDGKRVSIRRADRCLVEEGMGHIRQTLGAVFQSAVRIAVWLKVEGISLPVSAMTFQSAVRIAVWLKRDKPGIVRHIAVVSIRRADRCLVEVQRGKLFCEITQFQSAVRIAVWLKKGFTHSSHPGSQVSIRRADRCLVEAKQLREYLQKAALFQSAVRIAVWLKPSSLTSSSDRVPGFNPPCGSLFG